MQIDVGGVATSVSCTGSAWSGSLDVASLSDAGAIAISVTLESLSETASVVKDTSLPQVVSTTLTAGRYALTNTLIVELKFSEALTVTGVPRLGLVLDAQSATQLWLNYQSGSGSDTLVFHYTIATGDSDADGVTLASAIELNGGTLLDSAFNPAQLNSVTTAHPLVLVDSISPTVSSVVAPVNGTYAQGAELLVQVNFSESVTVSGLPRVAINIGGVTRWAVYANGSGSSGLEFKYTIDPSDQDTDGVELTAASLQLNGGTIVSLSDSDPAILSLAGHLPNLSSVIVNNALGITPPNQVTGVTTAPTTSSTQLSVAWSIPNNNGTAITHYVLQYRATGSSSWITAGQPTSNSATLSGLSAGVVYEVRVAASNGLLGPYSAVSTAEIFDVTSLNPIAWISATNVTNGGSEPAANDRVALWSDLTQTATDATESTPANQPFYRTNVQNNLPAIEFTGTQDRGLQGSFTRVNNGGLSIFMIGKFSGTARRAFFEFFRQGHAPGSAGDRRGFFFTYGYGNANTNLNLNNTQFNLWRVYDDGVKSTLWQNGTALYTDRTNEYGRTDFTGAGSYVLGDDQTGGDRLQGFIGEFLIFDRQLTAQEAATLSQYLKNKWGTP